MIDHVAYLVLARAAGATLTPEEAITVLNVLPQHDSVIAAILSRGFKEYDPSLAVKHGHRQLLPHYPSHVLSDGLNKTLGVAATLGDLATLDLLWRLAGPATSAYFVWFEDFENCFIATAVKSGNAPVLEWIAHAAHTTNISVNWSLQPWNDAATAGHVNAILWAIDHGHVRQLECTSALLSSRSGDKSILDWWITIQPSREAVMAQLRGTNVLVNVSKAAAISVLDWWWDYTGSNLPEPASLARIADAALSSNSLSVIECWWSRFLAHRTPEHTFGLAHVTMSIARFKRLEILDWYYDHYNESKDYFPTSPENMSGLVFTIKSHTTLPVLQWAVEKCAELDGQKLKLTNGFLNWCASVGRTDLLDLVVRSMDYLDMEWSRDFVPRAISYGQVSTLAWFDCHQDLFPPLNVEYCSMFLTDAAHLDAVDVFTWWLAHGFFAARGIWQHVCVKAITSNARRVQIWLHDHMDLFVSNASDDRFTNACATALSWAVPYTLDFMGAIFPDLDPIKCCLFPDRTFARLTLLFWHCARTHATIASLLPLEPNVFAALLESRNLLMLEWWLQAHVAAGHRLVLPAADEINQICMRNKDSHRWVYDVTATRKIPVYIKSGLGMEMYTSLPLSL